MTDEFKVTVYLTHFENGKQCDHIEYCETDSMEEAVRLAENWAMCKGYELVKATVEYREVPDWEVVYRRGSGKAD